MTADDPTAPDSTPAAGPLRTPRPCPNCGKLSLPATYPFCSKRCRMVDLNRWLTGAYTIPGSDTPDDDAA